MIVWSYGKGNVLVSVPGHDTIDWTMSADWPYASDFWINQMWYLAGLEIPRDIVQVHRIREMSKTYSSERAMVVSLIEFVEKFGAQTWELYDHLGRVDVEKKVADRLYLRGRYDESLEKMQMAYEDLGKVSQEAVDLKRKALFWIYLTERCVVAASSVITGLVLWTLMTRRKLYKEAGLTRLRETG